MYHEVFWTAKKSFRHLERIQHLIYRQTLPLPSFQYMSLPDIDPFPPIPENGCWETVPANSYWGNPVENFVLRTTFRIPEEWQEYPSLAILLPIGDAKNFVHPEALVIIDGKPCSGCDRFHQEITVQPEWRDGQTHQLTLTGWTGYLRARPGEKLLMGECCIAQIDEPTRRFASTVRVALGIVEELDADSPEHARLLNALNSAFGLLDTREPMGDDFYQSLPQAHECLIREIRAAGEPMDVDMVCAGHSHIDVAWLWTLGKTRRKCINTFFNVLRLMEKYPNFIFTQSQPQIYDYIGQDLPELLEMVKQRVKEGRWEPIGGMWVESDCNLPGAESLARQFLLGRAFFREQFGPQADSPVLWLPDVFGFTWSLPQLIKLAGLKYFFTIKMGWSEYNRIPYDTFMWQGIDGTRILTHFGTTRETDGARYSTYNATVTPKQVMGTWQNFQQKNIRQELLISYGYGDGGGGPTGEMVENISELGCFPGTPRVRTGRVGSFFEKLEEDTRSYPLPVWNNELYLELCRGTYTTQARNKRGNRKSEFLLHDAEFFAAWADLIDPGYSYPRETFTKAWQLVCLNQFHDIIPGSSIGPVYVESLKQYEAIQSMAVEARDAALMAIAAYTGGDLLLANPTSFERNDLAFWHGHLGSGQRIRRADGTPVASQETAEGTWLDAGNIAPFSVLPVSVENATAPGNPLSGSLIVNPRLLENDLIRIELDDDSYICRIYDKQNQREVLPADALANQLIAFEDRPTDLDAWDIHSFFEEKQWLAERPDSIRVVEAGPLRATIEVRRSILHSQIIQRISLAYNSPRVDFDTVCDWNEHHVLLKAAFPVEIFSPSATYEIQWGSIQRPTHRSTSWDWAHFEDYAQKWADLSEGDYGVSVLNDCKYGYDIYDNVIRISLLRSSTYPDPDADQGEHCFTYSLLPHAGPLGQETIREGYALNDPLIVVAGTQADGRTVDPGSMISVDQNSLVVETVKGAEDGRGVIVRMYESCRQRGEVTLHAGFELKEAYLTNLIEEDQAQLPVDGKRVRLPYTPFQILNLRLLPAE